MQVKRCTNVGYHRSKRDTKREHCRLRENQHVDAEHKCVEETVIASSHAVIDPWAVVVEALYAAVADVAMPAPRSAYNFAVGAQAGSLKLLCEYLPLDNQLKRYLRLPGTRDFC